MIDYEPHRWRDHFFDARGSMARAIGFRALVCAASAAFLTLVHYRWHEFETTEKVHALIGTPLSLLLVFRTNASYDRFWEARKLWGSIVNESRNLARLVCVLLNDAPDLRDSIVRWTTAWAYSAMYSLRGARGLGPPGDTLPESETTAMLAAQHVPLAVATRISRDLDEARRRGVISDYQQMALDQNVQLLVDYLGACERIHKTPLPFAYVVHLRRALILYCFSLPFALVDPFGWATVGLVFVLAYTFFGIEEIGVEIEDPFGEDDNDLPLRRLCITIEKNLTALIEPR